MKTDTLYLECHSGISGDMMVAALLDLGADREILKKALDSLAVPGFQVKISRVTKAGLDVCDFDVRLDAAHENHDHDMAYLYGNGPHGDGHGHAHHEQHEEHHHEHHHEHRGLSEILSIIAGADMTAGAKETAEKIFRILAEAEAKAHGTTVENVHFHEVGAVDSIVDILSVSVCLDSLGIKDVVIPELCEGKGEIRCAHGILSVPVPAVANIVAAHGIPLKITDVTGELVTPTGAAIAAAIRTEEKLPGSFTIKKIGMGAGKRAYERPSILRAMLIEPQPEEGAKERDVICKLESNIDDCTGEALGYVLERLFAAGARDVHYMPVYMKKNRPGYQINVICDETDIRKMEEIIFKETTTIGIRRQKMERSILKRQQATVSTPYGEILCKVCDYPDGSRRYYPEYESVAGAAKAKKIAFEEVYRAALAAAEKTDIRNEK